MYAYIALPVEAAQNDDSSASALLTNIADGARWGSLFGVGDLVASRPSSVRRQRATERVASRSSRDDEAHST